MARAVIGGLVTTALDAGVMLRTYSGRFIATIGAMSKQQWSYRAPSGGWSVSEVTEHVAIANEGVFRRLSRGLETPLRDPLGVADDEIPYLFYRGDEPPNVATPTGTWTDIDDGATAFQASARALVGWAADTELDLRSYGASHTVFGLMDGVQWLLFASAHTERHRRQLLGFQGRGSAWLAAAYAGSPCYPSGRRRLPSWAGRPVLRVRHSVCHRVRHRVRHTSPPSWCL